MCARACCCACTCPYLVVHTHTHARTHARTYVRGVLNYAACIFSGLFGGSQSLAGNPASLRAHRVTRLEVRKTRENFSISQQAAPARDLAERQAERERERGRESTMEKKEGRKEGEKPPLEWKRLETGNRITPEFLTRRIPAGCSRNLSEGIIRKRSRRERERGRLEKPEEDWNGNSSGRTNGTMKFTRQQRFFFHFRHFQSPRIPFDCGFGARKRRDRGCLVFHVSLWKRAICDRIRGPVRYTSD